MPCRQCGTEIADKALICYKCGAATTDPVFAPPAEARAWPRVSLVTLASAMLAAALVAGGVLYLSGASPDGARRPVAWIVAGVAVAIVALRAYARRR